MPTLASIQVGMPRQFGREDAENPFDRPWTSGIFKLPVTGPVEITKYGLIGDGQADLENHGGDDKAVLSYSADHYPGWLPILGPDSATFGAFGENLTIRGLTEDDVCVGDVWQIGEAVQLQISQPRQPCWKLARKWRVRDLVEQVQHTGRSGWYWRVLRPGRVEAGQPLTMLNRTRPEWTIAAANRAMYHRKHDRAAAMALAELPELAGSWRRHFSSRAARLASE